MQLVAVKVLPASGSGRVSDLVAGLNWVSNNAIPGQSVVSLSVGSAASNNFKSAIDSLYFGGIPIFGSAGNDSKDACLHSPANAEVGCYAVGNSEQ